MGLVQVDDVDPLPIGPSGDDDFLTWLSGQWWAPWAMLVVFMVVGLWMIRSMVIHRGRARQIERAAAAAGMRYRE